MPARLALRPAVLFLTVAAGLALAGCAGTSGDRSRAPINPLLPQLSERELRMEADELYRQARRALDSADFSTAIMRYGQIKIRYPFTEYATQAQLEGIYARYRNFELDSALTEADRFLREHPRHPHIDYVYYLRGLINAQRGEKLLEALPFVDGTKADVSYARRAYDDFALLYQRYPDSRYAGDARERMIALRNDMAAHEMNVIRFYLRRGAHVAVIRRAEQILAQYPGAPATVEALRALEVSYRALGMGEQADEAQRILQINNLAPADAAALVEGRTPAPQAVEGTPPPMQPGPERDEGAILNP